MTATMPTGRRPTGVRSALADHAGARILASLAAGLTLGLLFPRNPVVLAIAQSGTWFPKTVVTFATAIIFVLMSAALAKTLLTHRRSGRFLLYVIGLYVFMGFVSLLYVSAWIPALTGLPMNRPGRALPGLGGWLHGIATAFATVFTEQPLRISMVEIGLLIPPVLLLGLESPGVPGGAGVFMSPVIASLLAVPDSGLFVTTFVTLYSGFVPMLATAGNTTDDGFVGAFINDRVTDSETVGATAPMPSPPPAAIRYPGPVRAAAACLLLAAIWMIVAPQARSGLPALQWLARSTFPGEALVGAGALLVALTGLLGGRPGRRASRHAQEERC